MSDANRMFDALLHLGYVQLKDGLCEDALDTFSAAYLLDENDDRAIQARTLAHAQLNKVVV